MSTEDRRFTQQWDAVDPFDTEYPHLWIKVEHLGRYLFAANLLKRLRADSIADIGSGAGYGTLELATSGAIVIGIDSDDQAIQISNSKNTSASVTFGRATFGNQELHQILGSRTLDAAVCYETIEHLTDPEAALRELASLIVPDGTVILSVPNSVAERTDPEGLMSNPYHRRMFTITSISALLNTTGFTVREVLGQPLAAEINRNETRLLRRKQTIGRIGDESAFHTEETIRRMALAIGYPEPRDVERSYSLIIVAQRNRNS